LGFIESEQVAKLYYFCGYDRQSIEDAIVYLNEYKELMEIMDRARIMAFLKEDEEEDKPKFRMDAEGNLCRIED
jgi:prespore-specific regulator